VLRTWERWDPTATVITHKPVLGIQHLWQTVPFAIPPVETVLVLEIPRAGPAMVVLFAAGPLRVPVQPVFGATTMTGTPDRYRDSPQRERRHPEHRLVRYRCLVCWRTTWAHYRAEHPDACRERRKSLGMRK